MPARNHPEEFAAKGHKEVWHSYGLQGLPAGRFLKVVNRILTGRHILISTRSNLNDQDRAAIRTINRTD